MHSPQVIAVFDFDGTLTYRDSMLAFFRFVAGKRRYYLGMLLLAPWVLAYQLGLCSRKFAKQRFLRFFLKGKSEEALYQLGQSFSVLILPHLLRPQGLARIQWHQQQGHRCVLLTASLPFWTRAWAEARGLQLIATRPEIRQGIFTGRIRGKNCRGKEKVRRLQLALQPTPRHLLYLHAYGDSQGDKALLAWADQAHWKPFEADSCM